ncbi:MAG: hypothetical protein JWR22_2830 [Herminiimonas sp.]|nr:hypothetical protein [Herminiimonas sp.]
MKHAYEKHLTGAILKCSKLASTKGKRWYITKCPMILLLVLLGLTSTKILAEERTLTVTACVDGRDSLIIKGDTAAWRYFSNSPVGAVRDDCPTTLTTLSTTVNGAPALTNLQWQPVFSALNPASGDLSDQYVAQSVLMPVTDMSVSLIALQAREVVAGQSPTVSIAQIPSSTNGQTLIIDINDDGYGGATMYSVQVNFSYLPSVNTVGQQKMSATPAAQNINPRANPFGPVPRNTK